MSPTALPSSKRDQRLDFLRGLALLTIFINHVPGNALEQLTSRNFGFSDAAEAFVLMSGIAAALAYTRSVKDSLPDGVGRATARAFKLYRTHILITVLALGVVGVFGLAFSDYGMFSRNNMQIMQTAPLAGAVGILTFGHQFGYFNILPLYCVLLLVAPVMILAALRSPALLLVISTAIWLAAGICRVNFPNYPTDGGWFLNPLSWQLIFAIGIVIGLAAKEKRKFCPYHPVAFALALAYLIFSCIVVQMSFWNEIALPHLPQVLAGFDKSYLSLPRLLHVLALAYVAIHMTAVARIANARWTTPLRLLGSHSLAVFATGSVVCIALQTMRSAYATNWIEDLVLLSAGLGIQFGAARWNDIKSAGLAGFMSLTGRRVLGN